MKREDEKALKVYKAYVALKAHFSTPRYDFFKQRGRTRASWNSFQRRADRYFFYRLSKEKHWFDWLLANIAYDDGWIGDIVLNETAQKNFKKFRRIKESLTYTISCDLKKLKPKIDDNLAIRDGHPYIIQLYIRGEIELETLCIVSGLTHAIPYWDGVMEFDPFYKEYRRRICKYNKFLQYNQEVKNLVRSYINKEPETVTKKI